MADLTGLDPRKWFQTSTVISFILISALGGLLVAWTFFPPLYTEEQTKVFLRLLDLLQIGVIGVIAYFLKKD
jgi:hypothetical protein